MNQIQNMNNAYQIMMNMQYQNNNIGQMNQIQMDNYQRMMPMNQINQINNNNNIRGNNYSMNNNMNNNMMMYNNMKDVEIEKLRSELANAHTIIEQQKITINNLQIELNKHLNNNSLQNIIIQKEIEINNLKLLLKNNNIKDEKLYKFDDIMIVNFISTDSKVHFAVKCVKNNTFAEIEEKLYREYPEYRETNNTFLANGNQVLRFKTIEENKIGNGLPVTLIAPLE